MTAFFVQMPCNLVIVCPMNLKLSSCIFFAGENFQGPGDSLPFSSGASTSKPLMAVKVVAFFMVPFSVPFIAAKRSISKNGLTTKW
eukprot:m.129302 g.129302  ORF g.129302 m.129302 type:complete len:86 (+) comp17458_c0_seq6:39-296(+)